MSRRILKLFIYVIVLTAVLGFGVWIGGRGIGISREKESEQIASIHDKNYVADVGAEKKLGKSGTRESDVRIELFEPPAINATRAAKVTRVLDGDTIEIEGGQKVRYLGVNAPESGEPFSTEATRENERLAAGRAVNLEFDVQTRDRYGRLLAYVWSGDILVNREIVKNGFAVSETIQPDVKYQDVILEAQKEARAACRGLWAGLCSSAAGVSLKESCVKIINVNADSSGNDNNNKNGEWVEMKNTCGKAVSMTGWLLKDSSASNKYQFSDFTFEGGDSVIIYSGCGVNAKDKLYWQCPEGKYAVWNNAGDHAFLYDSNGNLVSDYQY